MVSSGNIVMPVDPAMVNRRDIRERLPPGLEIQFKLRGSGLGYRQFIPIAQMHMDGKDATRQKMRRIAAMAIDEVIQKLEIAGAFK